MLTYPIFGNGAGGSAILNVELETFGVATSATQALSGGQVAANTVPFAVSWDYGLQQNNHDGRECCIMTEVFDDGGTATVRATRTANPGTANMAVYTVEFNPAKVRVQKLSFSGTFNQTQALACTEVDQSKAFLLVTHKTTAVGFGANLFNLEAWFSSNTEVTVKKGIASNQDFEGIVYVIEDISGDVFDVQAFNGSISTATTFADHTITAVDLDKTMLVVNNLSESGSEGEDYSTLKCKFTSTTNARVNNVSSRAVTKAYRGFVVEWSDPAVVGVQRGDLNYTATNTNAEETTTLAITQVGTVGTSIPRLTNNQPWVPATNSASSYDASEIPHRFTLDGTGENVLARHWDTVFSVTFSSSWEMIEFDLT